MPPTPDAIDLFQQLGKKVAMARKSKLLTQAQLASRTGLTRASVANIELGRQRPPIDTLWNLGRALGVDPRDLLPPSPQAADADGTVSGVLDRLAPSVRANLRLKEAGSSLQEFIVRAKKDLIPKTEREV